MRSAEFILALLVAVAALVTLASRLRVAYPILLVIGGLGVGLVPGVPRVVVDPDVIFSVVLPPIVYVAAFCVPLRTLKSNIRSVASLAVGLVIGRGNLGLRCPPPIPATAPPMSAPLRRAEGDRSCRRGGR
jgi:CPA1 family monovalent cation:H+ antiporter